jgi:hypothetical protein
MRRVNYLKLWNLDISTKNGTYSSVRRCSLGASQEKPVRYFLVVCFTAATLMTLDLVSSGLRTFGGPAAVPSRATVIFKNQVEPTLAQLDLRAAKPDRANDVNSDVGIVLQPRLTQGI